MIIQLLFLPQTLFTTVATTALNNVAITFRVSSIRSQYNVSSVTKNGTGDYTVNFTTPMADANYSISAIAESLVGAGNVTPSGNITLWRPYPPTTSSLRVISVTKDFTTFADVQYCSVTIFGN